MSICYRAATVHVWISAATDGFIMGLMCIHKTSYSCCNHRLYFSCEPNSTRFPLLVACLCDPLIDGPFTVISMFHLTPFPTGQIFPLFIGEELIWISNFHTINYFVISASSYSAPDTTTVIYSTTASKAPSTKSMYAASSSIHSVDTAPSANTSRLGGNPACLSA